MTPVPRLIEIGREMRPSRPQMFPLEESRRSLTLHGSARWPGRSDVRRR